MDEEIKAKLDEIEKKIEMMDYIMNRLASSLDEAITSVNYILNALYPNVHENRSEPN